MKMRTLRKLKTHAPRKLRRFDFDVTDASLEQDPGPAPEAVFDRSTGPWHRGRGVTMPGMADEET